MVCMSGCAGYVGAAMRSAGPGGTAFARMARGRVVASTDFARIEQLADGVWGVVSTPLGDSPRRFTTTANGGIIAGRNGLLVIEGFMSDEGAGWVREQAIRLSGKEPTHVLVTHFHADHCRGLRALVQGGDAATLATAKTRELIRKDEEPLVPRDEITGQHSHIDLGDRQVNVVARLGHTPSDVTVHLQDPAVIWCGDLVWNGMFPNFTDAIPSHITRHCEQILHHPGTVYVPGHGDLSDDAGLDAYVGLLHAVESAARDAIESGRPLDVAAADFELPASLGTWVSFSPDYYERAFRAWKRELAS